MNDNAPDCNCKAEHERRMATADAARDLVRSLLKDSDDIAVIVAVHHHNGTTMSYFCREDLRMLGLIEHIRSCKSHFLPDHKHREGDEPPPVAVHATRN